MRCPEAWICPNQESVSINITKFGWLHTLTASVQIAATTSRDPPSTRLPGNSGSYSQIAFIFSMTAIFVMCPITVTFARLTTCSRHLDTTWMVSKTLLIVMGADSRRHPIGSGDGDVALLPSHSSSCCLKHYRELRYEAASQYVIALSVILSVVWLNQYLRSFLTHNPHAVAKADKVSTQIPPTMLPRNWLKPYDFCVQLPLFVFHLDPMCRHSKEGSLRVIRCPSIGCRCNFTWCLLPEFVSSTLISLMSY